MRQESARVGTTSAPGSAVPLPRSITAPRNASTTTWAASTRAVTTWTTRRPTRSSRPADQTRRVERRRRRHSRVRERRWFRLSTWRSSGSKRSAGVSLTGAPGGGSPEQVLGAQLGEERRDVGLRGGAVDAVVRHEGLGQLVAGPLRGEQLGEERPGGVRREVDRPFGVEDDELAVDLPPGDAFAAQLHVRSSNSRRYGRSEEHTA